MLKNVVPVDHQLTKSHNDAMTNGVMGLSWIRKLQIQTPGALPVNKILHGEVAGEGKLSKN